MQYRGLTLSAYAVGTAYSLTNTAAKLDFGTTDPSISLIVPGRYLVEGQANIQDNAATFAASRTVTIKLRDTTNNADLTNGSAALITGIVTTLTAQLGLAYVVAEITITAAATVQLWGDVSVAPSAGSLDAVAPGTWIRASYLGPV